MLNSNSSYFIGLYSYSYDDSPTWYSMNTAYNTIDSLRANGADVGHKYGYFSYTASFDPDLYTIQSSIFSNIV